MTNYYALVFNSTTNVGDTIPNTGTDDHPTPVVTDPRAFELADILDARDLRDNITDIVHSEVIRIAQVTPLGEVRPHPEFYMGGTEITPGIMLEADDGWRIESFKPNHTILGDQGERAMQILNTLESAANEDDDRIAHYRDALEADFGVIEENADLAIVALEAVGADSYWWTNCTGSDEFGFEVVALAARDLIDHVEGWDQEAYDAIAAPYRVAFGEPLHPEDTPVSVPVA